MRSTLAEAYPVLIRKPAIFLSMTTDELKQDFASARIKHVHFKSKLRSFLFGNGGAEGPLRDPEQCQLGLWITDRLRGNGAYAHLPEARQFDRRHILIHNEANRLMNLYNEGKHYAIAVYFDDLTELRRNILQHEEKVRTMDEMNDQLLEEMMFQEKLILETNRQAILAFIQSDLVASYQHALDQLTVNNDDATLRQVKSDLHETLVQLRSTVKELRSQAEEIMNIKRLIETCISLYDPQRINITIEPSADLKVLTFVQASAIYLAVRQILDFASLQPECYAADIILQKVRGRLVLVAGLRCTRKIEDHLINEFEINVFARGQKKSDGVNIMNSDTGCIIYAVLEA